MNTGPIAQAETPGGPPSGDLALVLLLSGPAGTGKTTLCERLVSSEPNVLRVVTSTTRAPRPGELHGRDYYFFDEETFERMAVSGEFLEHAHVHGRRYGTLRSEVMGKLAQGNDVIFNVDIQGAENFRRAAAEIPDLRRRLVTLFLMPDSIESLRERLRGRGAAPEDIERRMETARREVEAWASFDFCFTSTTRDADYAALLSIWRSEKLSVRRLSAQAT